MEGTEMNKKGCRDGKGWEGMRRNIREGKEWEEMEYYGIGRDGDDEGSEWMGKYRKEWQGMGNIVRDWDEREGREAERLGKECIGKDEKEWKGRK